MVVAAEESHTSPGGSPPRPRRAGSRKQASTDAFAGNILRLARMKAQLTQRELAAAAGMNQADIALIETGRRQPSIPTLSKLLHAAGQELRVHLAPYDDHDDLLDEADARLSPAALARRHGQVRKVAEELRTAPDVTPRQRRTRSA